MKRVFGWIFVLLPLALLLAGCGGTKSAAPISTAEPELKPTALPPDPPTPTGVVEKVDETDASRVEHDPTNFALIGTTGRPQFLNAYASW